MYNRYAQESSHERAMKQLNPTICSCSESPIDTKNSPDMYATTLHCKQFWQPVH
jgi:hypothetical protein